MRVRETGVAGLAVVAVAVGWGIGALPTGPTPSRASGALGATGDTARADWVPGFWTHWGDGKAELNGYRLVQPRYGALRPGTAVMIFVTEDFSDSLRVKADPGRHPARDVYPVLKLNAVRDFQTGIYDYNVMTSSFLRVASGWPVAKVSFSSQEWCGNVYAQLLPRGAQIVLNSHSYFDGEADAVSQLPLPAEPALFEDALPVTLRGWGGAILEPGQRRTFPYLPSLLRSRLEHRSLRWGRATLARSAATSSLTVPAGRFEVVTWTLDADGGPRTTYEVEAAPPYRLVKWGVDSGEEAVLLGSERLAYWKLNAPGGEAHLARLGLAPQAVVK